MDRASLPPRLKITEVLGNQEVLTKIEDTYDKQYDRIQISRGGEYIIDTGFDESMKVYGFVEYLSARGPAIGRIMSEHPFDVLRATKRVTIQSDGTEKTHISYMGGKFSVGATIYRREGLIEGGYIQLNSNHQGGAGLHMTYDPNGQVAESMTDLGVANQNQILQAIGVEFT